MENSEPFLPRMQGHLADMTISRRRAEMTTGQRVTGQVGQQI